MSVHVHKCFIFSPGNVEQSEFDRIFTLIKEGEFGILDLLAPLYMAGVDIEIFDDESNLYDLIKKMSVHTLAEMLLGASVEASNLKIGGSGHARGHHDVTGAEFNLTMSPADVIEMLLEITEEVEASTDEVSHPVDMAGSQLVGSKNIRF